MTVRAGSRPGSPITRVHGDASMFVGGLRALLLQTLHPAAMRAVSEHSGYRGDMWGRLHRTSTFLAVTTFGVADDAEQAVDAVRRIHERVTGTMPDGTPYAASDPHLLAWVHAAEADSFLRAHQVYGRRPLDQAGRDEYVAQIAQVGARLGVVDPPTTEAELAEVLAAYRPELRGTPEAREAVRLRAAQAAAAPGRAAAVRRARGGRDRADAAPGPGCRCGCPTYRSPSAPTVRVLGGLATGTIRWAMSADVRRPTCRPRTSRPSSR